MGLSVRGRLATITVTLFHLRLISLYFHFEKPTEKNGSGLEFCIKQKGFPRVDLHRNLTNRPHGQFNRRFIRVFSESTKFN